MELNPGTTKTLPFTREAEKSELSESMRLTRYCELEELPVLVFGVITVIYIFLSLAGLA